MCANIILTLANIFCQYELLIDVNAHKKKVAPCFVPKTFYGQLQSIFMLHIPVAEQLGLAKPETLIRINSYMQGHSQ